MKINLVQAGGAMVVGGAVAAGMMVHPVTLLAKCTGILLGVVVGAMAIAPLQEQIGNLTVDLAELHISFEKAAARMAQVSAPSG